MGRDVPRGAPQRACPRVPDSVTLEGLEALAREAWQDLPPHAVLWLSGDLGTGKTAFAQALARQAGAESVTSPTFALVQEYESPEGRIVHADCYRLRSPEEAIDLDLEAAAREARVTIIEWPERAGPYAPLPTMQFHFGYGVAHTERRVRRSP